MTSSFDSSRMLCSPVVTVIIANHNGAAYLCDAVRSVQRQSLRELEIIVSDDGSSDSSIDIISRLMAEDPRLRLLQSGSNRGPAAARNSALAVAQGEWIAVMDSDDLMHPLRLNRLVEAARLDGAEVAADNMIEFFEDRSAPPRPFLAGSWQNEPRWVSLVEFIEHNHFYVRGPKLGNLHPLFHSSAFSQGHRYDETLTIAEDYDLVARLLCSGRKLRVYPDAWYFYRKHPSSLSRRGTRKAFEALRTANLRFLSETPSHQQDLIDALNRRTRSIETVLIYQSLVDGLKTGRWSKSLRIAFANPRVAALLRNAVGGRLRGRLRRSGLPATSNSENVLDFFA